MEGTLADLCAGWAVGRGALHAGELQKRSEWRRKYNARFFVLTCDELAWFPAPRTNELTCSSWRFTAEGERRAITLHHQLSVGMKGDSLVIAGPGSAVIVKAASEAELHSWHASLTALVHGLRQDSRIARMYVRERASLFSSLAFAEHPHAGSRNHRERAVRKTFFSAARATARKNGLGALVSSNEEPLLLSLTSVPTAAAGWSNEQTSVRAHLILSHVHVQGRTDSACAVAPRAGIRRDHGRNRRCGPPLAAPSYPRGAVAILIQACNRAPAARRWLGQRRTHAPQQHALRTRRSLQVAPTSPMPVLSHGSWWRACTIRGCRTPLNMPGFAARRMAVGREAVLQVAPAPRATPIMVAGPLRSRCLRRVSRSSAAKYWRVFDSSAPVACPPHTCTRATSSFVAWRCRWARPPTLVGRASSPSTSLRWSAHRASRIRLTSPCRVCTRRRSRHSPSRVTCSHSAMFSTS